MFDGHWWLIPIWGFLFGFGFAAGQALFAGVIGLFKPKT